MTDKPPNLRPANRCNTCAKKEYIAHVDGYYTIHCTKYPNSTITFDEVCDSYEQEQ